MARLARITVPGFPHHVAQEGIGGRRVFEIESDYRLYLDWLEEYANRYGVEIWAYCLMPTRVDIVCVPRSPKSLALAFNSLHMRYAQFINGRNGRSGPLWRPRFMSCVMDEPTAREDVRYVETIPVRVGAVADPCDYGWSSTMSHIMGASVDLRFPCLPLNAQFPDWLAYLEGEGDKNLTSRLIARLKTGRPAGDRAFVLMLEKLTGRLLDALPRGRPRKVLVG